MTSLFLAPHQDDENLFGSYTLQREKPLVVVITDGFIQGNRGDSITAEQRRAESRMASELIGYPLYMPGLRDDQLNEDGIIKLFHRLSGFKKVYAPAVQGGNWQHDLIGELASKWFQNVIHYTTYTPTELWTKGRTEIIPTQEEIDLKNKALDCYQSQINLGATAPHFKAVRGKSEFYE